MPVGWAICRVSVGTTKPPLSLPLNVELSSLFIGVLEPPPAPFAFALAEWTVDEGFVVLMVLRGGPSFGGEVSMLVTEVLPPPAPPMREYWFLRIDFMDLAEERGVGGLPASLRFSGLMRYLNLSKSTLGSRSSSTRFIGVFLRLVVVVVVVVSG